jgi:uncharacterized protein YutE (UPF0331/DUF86 family)
MGPADRSLILRKISDLEKYQEQIEEFSGITAKEYRGDWKTQRIIERTLQLMIETCVDVANHIIAEAGMRVPVSYADTFRVLHEKNLIDTALFSTLEKMAKFRNIIVHDYEEVDAEIVVAIMTRHLQDFDKFKTAVLEYLNKPV